MLSSFISETTDATPTKLDTLYEYVLEKVLKHFEHAPPTHSAYRAIFLPCGQAFRDVTMSDNYLYVTMSDNPTKIRRHTGGEQKRPVGPICSEYN